MASLWARVLEKLNPVQEEIYRSEGGTSSSSQTKLLNIQKAYEIVEVVNRCVNLLVDNASLVNYDVADTLGFTGQSGHSIKGSTLNRLLNVRPNPYMDISTFRRLILLDFLIDGNVFIHFDGTALYHIPARDMKIVADDTTYINSFEYNKAVFKPNEIIFIRDNSTKSLYRGDSRINSSLQSLYTRESMLNFQKSFFDNGAAVGLIVETEAVLSKKLKERQEREWMANFNPTKGGSRPLILDAGMKVKSTSSSNFREMSFSESIRELEKNTAIALGIPPILLDSGNNANIKPNLELLFYTTILPMLSKFEAGFEYYFAFDIETSTHRVPALKPDLKDQAERISSLVNNGIITGNEGRGMMRLEELDEDVMKKIRIPANIAGSASHVSGQEGGAPARTEE